MVQGEYTATDLYRLYLEQGGAYNLTTLNGEPLLIDYSESEEVLKVAGADFYVSNIEGIDG